MNMQTEYDKQNAYKIVSVSDCLIDKMVVVKIMPSMRRRKQPLCPTFPCFCRHQQLF